jgi:hypothetical protein
MMHMWSHLTGVRVCVCMRVSPPRPQAFASTTSASTAIADHFALMNEALLKDPDLQPEARGPTDAVLSFSHFLPREVRVCAWLCVCGRALRRRSEGWYV